MIKLLNLLKELNIQSKDSIGQGSEHTVYPSKIKPGFVIKKFDEGNVEKSEWVECIQVAQQHPELFAKIDKVDFDKEYVVQEKLDERSLTKDLNKLENYLLANPPTQFTDDERVDKYGDFNDSLEILVTYPDKINVLDNTPYKKTLKPKLEDFLKRIKDAGFEGSLRDVRISNVGYDAAGKIKILDFQLNPL